MLSYDPDAAGQGAAERSSLLLVQEGFLVNVALLPPGDDPDGFIRKNGVAADPDLIKASRPYVEDPHRPGRPGGGGISAATRCGATS